MLALNFSVRDKQWYVTYFVVLAHCFDVLLALHTTKYEWSAGDPFLPERRRIARDLIVLRAVIEKVKGGYREGVVYFGGRRGEGERRLRPRVVVKVQLYLDGSTQRSAGRSSIKGGGLSLYLNFAKEGLCVHNHGVPGLEFEWNGKHFTRDRARAILPY